MRYGYALLCFVQVLLGTAVAVLEWFNGFALSANLLVHAFSTTGVFIGSAGPVVDLLIDVECHAGICSCFTIWAFRATQTFR